MKKDPGTIALLFTTFCVVFCVSSYFFNYLESKDAGNIISTVLFIASIVCLIIAWGKKIHKWRKKDK